MKKILAILVISLFFGSAWAGMTGFHVMPKETTVAKTIEKTFTFSPPTIQDIGKYAIIANGYKSTMEQGYPIMPYKVEVMRFPVGTKIKFEYNVGETNEMKLDKKIMPYPHVVTLGSPKNELTEGAVYKEDTFYPEKWIEPRYTVGLYNGKRVVTLSVFMHPYRYNAVRNEIEYAKQMKIKVDYELPTKPLFTASNYDLLIIAPDQWLDALQPLVQFKDQHGMRTKLVGLSECLKMNGRDDAEKVKYYIKQEIEQDGIKYVMLVGGRHGGVLHEKWWMPVRYAHLDDNSNWERSYLSDLYFADIYKYVNGKIEFEDWDSNHDGIFAEWTGLKKDILDLVPDVYVGRLACRSLREVKDMVNKIIEYESSNAKQQDWFKRMVLVGGDTFPAKDDIYYEGEVATNLSYHYMQPLGVQPVRLWASDGSLLKNQTPDTAWKNVVAAISKGAGFVDFEGHGNPMSWATHPPHNESVWINGLLVNEMHYMQNKGMYPIIMIGGCHNSQFNVSVLNLIKFNLHKIYETYYKSEWSPETWGWWIIRMPDKGGIASVGCTALGYGAVYDENHDGIPDCIQQYGGWIDTHFFKLIGNGNATHVGDAHSMSIADYVVNFQCMKDKIDCKTVEEWVLLGDPSLQIGGY